nr:hypothetical protein CFP56_70942 [Quercus suber]
MGHDDKHCLENSDWRNAPRQYGDWLRANGKVGSEKSWSTSSGGRDEVGDVRDEENVLTTARNPCASVTVDGEGSSGNSEKQAQSDKGSMMGWEVIGFPRCQLVEKPIDGTTPFKFKWETIQGRQQLHVQAWITP